MERSILLKKYPKNGEVDIVRKLHKNVRVEQKERHEQGDRYE